jgi:beta-lactamase regulating signal transducer with metallopeptidase domain
MTPPGTTRAFAANLAENIIVHQLMRRGSFSAKRAFIYQKTVKTTAVPTTIATQTTMTTITSTTTSKYRIMTQEILTTGISIHAVIIGALKLIHVPEQSESHL